MKELIVEWMPFLEEEDDPDQVLFALVHEQTDQILYLGASWSTPVVELLQSDAFGPVFEQLLESHGSGEELDYYLLIGEIGEGPAPDADLLNEICNLIATTEEPVGNPEP